MAEFRKLYPNVKFRFRQGTYPTLIRDVVSGEIDLAFISPFPENHDQVVGNVMLTEDLVAILPPGHPLSGEQSITLYQLKDDKFILFSKGYSLRPIVWHACLEAGFTPKIAFEGEETDTIRGLVAAGMGVSLLPETALFQSFSLQPSRVRISVPKVTRTIGLIHRADEKLPLVAQSFRIFLLEYFGLQTDTPPSQ
ncbi:HTH-type transcriptional regulator GltC [compost metagenome]